MPKRKKSSSKKPTKTKPKKTANKTKPKGKQEVSVKELYDTSSFYCQIQVSDYKRSLKFYSEILELEPSEFAKNVEDPETIGWYEFKLPLEGAFLGLGQPSQPELHTAKSTVIPVKNLDKLHSILLKKGANPVDITDVPNMISFFTINDPDNNSVMFICEPRVKS